MIYRLLEINLTFNKESQEVENISLSSKGYYSSFINDKKIDDFLNVNANLNGSYNLKYENNSIIFRGFWII